MKAQQLLKTRSDVTRWARLAILLLAVFSLASFSPNLAVAGDFGAQGCVGVVSGSEGCDRQAGKNAVSDTDTQPSFATDDSQSYLDDGNGYLAAIPHAGRGRAGDPLFAAITDRDGQPFAAFNSRAPPALG